MKKAKGVITLRKFVTFFSKEPLCSNWGFSGFSMSWSKGLHSSHVEPMTNPISSPFFFKAVQNFGHLSQESQCSAPREVNWCDGHSTELRTAALELLPVTWAACPPAPAAGSGSEQGLQKMSLMQCIPGWSSTCCRKSDVIWRKFLPGVHEEMEDRRLGERSTWQWQLRTGTLGFSSIKRKPKPTYSTGTSFGVWVKQTSGLQADSTPSLRASTWATRAGAKLPWLGKCAKPKLCRKLEVVLKPLVQRLTWEGEALGAAAWFWSYLTCSCTVSIWGGLTSSSGFTKAW